MTSIPKPGDRIRLLGMRDDPDPIQVGAQTLQMFAVLPVARDEEVRVPVVAQRRATGVDCVQQNGADRRD